MFLAGGLTEHLGTFVQGTYSGIERKFALDNADVRYAQPFGSRARRPSSG